MLLKRVLIVASLLGACTGEKTPEPTPPPAKQTGPVGPAVPSLSAAQRLTVAQYRNAVKDLFGDVVVPPALEPDVALDGLESVGASKSTISARGVEQYEAAAMSIGNQVIANPKFLEQVLPCKPVSVGDEACARTFATTFGRRAWRRPLTTDEANRFVEVVIGSGATLGTFEKGIVYGISAFLQSPNFLYRGAVGEDDPARPGNKRYTGFELATRLSFFLWNTIPDDALLDAAGSGALGSYEGVSKEVERMIASPKSREGLRSFVTQWLRLGALDQLSKDAKLFTTYNVELGPMAREETLRLFEDIVFDRDGDVRDVVTTRRTFLTPKLAAMYQVPAPTADGFAPVELPESSPRRGLLGEIAILALYAHPTSSSATLRGKFVREKLLCVEIPAPPVNVNTALPEPTPDAKTLRQRVKIHLTEPSCAGCHRVMDPIGLGLEIYDGIGRYRKTENGAAIDPSGDLDGVKFNNPAELASAIHEHRDFPWCITRKVYQYATGHKPAENESATVDALNERFKSDGYRLKSLLAAVATSPAFRAMGAPH
jgi:hypothetical protein